jgi:hypothetical protein
MQRIGTAAECLETLRAVNASSACRNRNVHILAHRRDLYWRALRIVSRKKSPVGDKARDAIKDSVDQALVDEISEAIREQRYKFTFVPPPGGMKAPPPPSLADHLVYEVLAMILCAIYDIPYKPKHPKLADVQSRHEAMKAVQDTCIGSTWMAVNKVDPAFLSTNHMVLMHMLRKRVEDKKLLTMIWSALKAGCMHELAATRSMTLDCLLRSPQSEKDQEHTLKAVLSEVYMRHLDEFVYEVLDSFEDAQLKRAHGVRDV